MTKNNSNKVLFLSNHLRGPKGSAGARSWHQTKELSIEYKVTVLIPKVDPVTSKVVTETDYEGLNKKVRVIPVWTTKNQRASRIARAIFFLSAFFSQAFNIMKLEKHDLVLCMSLPVTQLVLAYFVSRIWSVPLVIDVRDLPFETANELNYLRGFGLVVKGMKRIENSVLCRADHVITNSHWYLEHLERYGVKKERLTLAPIGYDDFPPPTNRDIELSRAQMAEYLPRDANVVLVYVGTLGYAFPLDAFIEAVSLVGEDLKLGALFYGDGQRKQEYEELALHLSANVGFPGRVSKTEVHSICRAADCCLYSCAAGNFSASILGNKIFDYLGAENSVIYMGPHSAVSELIEEVSAGYICGEKNVEELKNAMKAVTHAKLAQNKKIVQIDKLRCLGYTAAASAKKLNKIVHKLLDS